MTLIRRPAVRLSALASVLLMLLITAPAAVANVPPPDPTNTAPSVTFVYQSSGLALWGMVLIALAAGAVGALITVAAEHLTRSHRSHVLAA